MSKNNGEVKVVKIGDKKFALPFIDHIEFLPHQLESLRLSIEEDGAVHVPVVCWKEKSSKDVLTVVDGANRCIFASEFEFTKIPFHLKSFKSETEAMDFCEKINDDRRQSTDDGPERRRQARINRVVQSRQEGKSIRTIAQDEKISTQTVLQDIKRSQDSGVVISGKI